MRDEMPNPTNNALPLSAAARWGLIGLEASLTVVAVAIGWLVGSRPLEHFSLNVNHALIGAAATLPVLAAAAATVAFPIGPLRSLLRTVDELLVPLFKGWTLTEMAIVSLVAGVAEEMLFRGAIFVPAAARFGTPFGLVLSSVLFGLMHFLSPVYFAFATLMGTYLAWLLISTNNLLAPIVAHALYDFVVLVYVARVRRQNTPSSASQAGQLGHRIDS